MYSSKMLRSVQRGLVGAVGATGAALPVSVASIRESCAIRPWASDTCSGVMVATNAASSGVETLSAGVAAGVAVAVVASAGGAFASRLIRQPPNPRRERRVFYAHQDPPAKCKY